MMKIAVIFLALFISNEVVADIYKYTDNVGRVYYTDEPRNSLYKRIIKTKAFRYSSSNNYTGKVNAFSGVNKKRFTDLIEQAANRHQVDAKLVHAVIQTESAYNSTAQSPKGAVGLMQLMPDTARRFGVTDRNDPDQNVDGGTRYLKYLINLFNPNIDLAVAAYNAGENAVIRYNNSIPPYPETQNYVKQVLALYNH
ncbi:MAG: lytic transglycosylase domain-containing protein [Methylococcales bacterium]|nr:lytic transglycosylase domain-containing protein [Methylococcales bacterium]